MKIINPSRTTGAAAIASSLTAGGRGMHIREVVIHFSSAPTTSENITITLDSAGGAAYDTNYLTYDPSADSATDIKWNGVGQDTNGCYLAEDDALDIAYTNTDTRTYGITIYWTEGA